MFIIVHEFIFQALSINRLPVCLQYTKKSRGMSQNFLDDQIVGWLIDHELKKYFMGVKTWC